MLLVLCIFVPIVMGTTMFPIESQHLDLNNYYYFPSAFNSDEITRIRTMVQPDSFESATISKQTCPIKTKELRISDIQWIEEVPTSKWLYNKLLQLAKKANDAIYDFKLTHVKDSVQFTRYYGHQGGKYDWHIDLGQGDTIFRKLSIIVLLSDPSSFEGGSLQLRLGNQLVDAPLHSMGSVVIFPSFILHRVLPVTSGMRESLVAWISGFPFQ